MSKVEGLAHKGNILFTFTQTDFDQNNDYVERDPNGKLIGMWADYFKPNNLPVDTTQPPQTIPYAVITYGGTDPQVKVNGGYKAVTIAYYQDGELLKDQTPGNWLYLIDDTYVSDLVKVLETESPNTIKVKFLGDENYLGKVLTVRNVRDEIIADLQLNIISL